MKYEIEITDAEENSFRIDLRLPFNPKSTSLDNSKWRVLDEGYLTYRSGKCLSSSSDGDMFGSCDLLLRRRGNTGIFLYEFIDWASFINDSGTGTILQHWCTTVKPFHINWELV